MASRVTPMASETEISSTRPLGSIPSSAAAEETTASWTSAPRSSSAYASSAAPSGTISQLVKPVTRRIEPSSSEAAAFCCLTSAVRAAA